jgi:hypothetical protein
MSRGMHAEPLQSLNRGIYYLTVYMVNTAFTNDLNYFPIVGLKAF